MFIDMNGLVHNDGAALQNDRGPGTVGEYLNSIRWEPGLLRPFYHRGQNYVTINVGRQWDNAKQQYVPKFKTLPVSYLQQRGINSPVFNSYTLPKEAWIQLDQAVIRATRTRL